MDFTKIVERVRALGKQAYDEDITLDADEQLEQLIRGVVSSIHDEWYESYQEARREHLKL